MDTLKPCPFCGKPAEYSEEHDCPRCNNWDCFVDAHATVGTREVRIAAWNTRPREAELEARITELEKSEASLAETLRIANNTLKAYIKARNRVLP